ncbi:ATP-dependent Lon protease pim1 [Tulasnella sp. JGI-2019a]|nr:ATP-dependent Lon protease pim1 [Tulasnella sp. JGI-2019a]
MNVVILGRELTRLTTRCNALQHTSRLAIAGSSRSIYFSTSASRAMPLPSKPARYPRWINTRQGGNGAPPDKDSEKEAVERKDHDAEESSEASSSTVSASEDDATGAPPASSSGGSSPPSTPPASDSDPPPESPPPSSSDSSSSSSAPANSAVAKQAVPEIYPQVLALPITRRPLFPGFYKAVVIRNPHVVAAIKDMMKRGQPYLGAFLLKDEDADADIITDINSVHPVGVFAQITSVFPASTGNAEEGKEESLTAVLYPHRRIRITELITPAGKGPSTVSIGDVAQTVKEQEITDEGAIVAESSIESVGGSHAHPAPLQTSFLHDYPISLANVDNLVTQPYSKSNQYVRAIMSEIVSVFKDIAQLNPLFRDQITNFTISQSASNVFDEPDKLADFAAAVSTGEVNELQDVLESLVLEERLQKALLVLKKELINAQLQSKISRDVESKIQKRQREYYLMEQLKGIKKELGMETDGKDKLIEKFKERAASLKMPDQVRKVFDEELSKLAQLEPAASEANVTRNYLDWLTQIPWGQHSEENFSIQNAIKVLDEDHYGLTDIKDRILEFLAVGKLRGTVEGKIICFVGPPGVGKTSIGKSIARALNRQFFRFSVGGLTDVAEIKGHRRTYVGALPSKIIQALKRVGTENPLVLIDEIDKVGRGINGDPSSALLEMLDPEQNTAFLDHYMDVPVDLSRVLFVCTANSAETIPAPLLDRMEVIEVSGYVTEEKQVIADRYLAPQAKEATGLKEADVTLTKEAVDMLIKFYCRESGVRNLKKHIDKIYRKAAFKIVRDLGEDIFPEPSSKAATLAKEQPAETPKTEENTSPTPVAETAAENEEAKTVLNTTPESGSAANPSAETNAEERKTVTTIKRKPLQVPSSVSVTITAENLKNYVGPQIYHKDRFYTKAPPAGVSTGLGYLGNGSGAVMPVEAMSMPGKGGLQLTGKLGEVIRESAQIALSWVKAHAYDLNITKSATDQPFLDYDVHLHMPEGSIGKEGPSAGTAILSAFVSLLTKQPISPDIAMTGEISLVGQVLPVGGLKEKILAAHRAGIKTIIAPGGNRADIEENVPASVKSGIRFVYVEDVSEVLDEVFRGQHAVKAPVAETASESALPSGAL